MMIMGLLDGEFVLTLLQYVQKHLLFAQILLIYQFTFVSSDSANVFWEAGDLETSWEIAVQAPGSGIPSGSGTSTTSNSPHVLDALNINTSYEIYVRGFCGGSDFSNWVGPVNFTTLIPSRVDFTQQAMPIGGYDLTVVDMNGDNLDDIVSASQTNV